MSRYASTSLIKDINGVRKRSTTIVPAINVTENDTYIVTTSAERLDRLANTFYNDSTLWWAIASSNGLGKGTMIVPANTKLRIPARAEFIDNVTETNRSR
jgi:hypothetical protein